MADYSIALQGKPMQITSQEDYLKDIYAIQNAQQANQLNKMVLGEKQRGIAEDLEFKNAFARLNKTSPTYEQDEEAVYGLKGLEGLKALGAQRKERALTSETQFKAMSAKQDFDNQARRDLSFNSSDENVKAYVQDAVLKGIYTQEEATRIGAQLLAIPLEQRKAFLAGQGAKASDLIAKPSGLATLQNELAALPLNDPRRAAYEDAIRKETLSADMQAYETAKKQGFTGSLFDYKRQLAKAGSSTSTVVMPPQEKEFEKQVGKDQAEILKTSKASAEDAAQILATNMVGKNLLDKGMITGAGADFFVQLNKGLLRAGMDFGGADAAQNSQAYGALMAANTAKIIKQFGAGTGLSDADREYALKAAAGDIKMDEKAIRTILDINNRAAQNVINKHNKMVKTVEDKTKTILPYSVEVSDYTAGIPDGRTEKDNRKPLTSLIKSKRN